MTDTHQALVFGASGISGWAITRAAVLSQGDYAFKKVIGLTSRPLSIKESALPEDAKLELHGGLDLTQQLDDVTRFLSEIEALETRPTFTLQVFFSCYDQCSTDSTDFRGQAYIHGAFGATDSEARTKINVTILRNAVLAVERLAPNLQFWTLQSGAKVESTFCHCLERPPDRICSGTAPSSHIS